MTSTTETSRSWHQTSMLLNRLEPGHNPALLFGDLRTVDVPLDGEEVTWRKFCLSHKEATHEAAQQWSAKGSIPECSAEVMLLLRIRAATARMFLLGLMGSDDTFQGGLFPFPDSSQEDVARIFLTDWWDQAGWALAGRQWSLWAQSPPQ